MPRRSPHSHRDRLVGLCRHHQWALVACDARGLKLYFLNFEARADALITVAVDQDGFRDDGVEVQPWRLSVRPLRTGRMLTFHLRGAEKIVITRPGNLGSGSEMLYLFAIPTEDHAPTSTTAGVRFFGPGVHRENIDAVEGDHIYLADGEVIYGSLNIWQVDHVSVSGRGVIVNPGPQDPADDDDSMHKKNWHCIVMDQAHDISIEGITCVVRSRTSQIQMKDSCRIVFNNIKVIGANDGNANADGMDWLSSGGTVVKDSFFRAADDVFALQTSWDGYGAKAFPHQGQHVTNVSIEHGVFRTSITKIVRAGWPEKNFEGGNFTMRDADVIHMGLGRRGVPFALMELWADPNGRGLSSGFHFENVRLQDWYSLVQLPQPSVGVSEVSFRDITGLESPALIPSTLLGAIRGVTLDRAGMEPGTPLPEVLQGAEQSTMLDAGPEAKIIATQDWIPPGKRVRFEAGRSENESRHNHYHWTFGNGSEAFSRRSSHRFHDTEGTLLNGTGLFRVLLEVTSKAGRHSWAYEPVIVSRFLRPASIPMPHHAGLTYTYRETAPGATEAVTDVTSNLSLSSIPHAQVDYSISFDGFIQIPVDGAYGFLMVANEAATIQLDGIIRSTARQAIAQVCGLAGMAARGISVSPALRQGTHHLRVAKLMVPGKMISGCSGEGPLSPSNP